MAKSRVRGFFGNTRSVRKKRRRRVPRKSIKRAQKELGN